MRLVTVRRGKGTRATVLDADGRHHLLPVPSVDALLATLSWWHGPVLLTPGEADPVSGLTVLCTVDGELRQHASTRQLVFDPPTLLAYISAFTTLRAGDLVLTGTPGGVGSAAQQPSYLRDGSRVMTKTDGLGQLDNTVRFVPDPATGSPEQRAGNHPQSEGAH